MKNLEIAEVKGDIIFYMDEKGEYYQQLWDDEPYKVRDGSMTFKEITKVNGYIIKYNNNGVYGFSIWKGKTCLEDGYWVYDEVLSEAMKM